MKYLKLFKSEDEYNTYKTNPDYVTPNVCLVKTSTQKKMFFQPKIKEPNGGNFYILLNRYHPLTGALLSQYTFTFYINYLLTWEECNNLVDTTNRVKILSGFISELNKPIITLLSVNNKEFLISENQCINDIQLSDNIILNNTYEFIS